MREKRDRLRESMRKRKLRNGKLYNNKLPALSNTGFEPHALQDVLLLTKSKIIIQTQFQRERESQTKPL